MSLNPVTKQKIRNLEKKFYTSLNLRFGLVFLVLSIVVTFWSFYDEVLAEPYYYPQDGQFAKTLSDAPESSFSARRTVTKKIADFQNSVTRL